MMKLFFQYTDQREAGGVQATQPSVGGFVKKFEDEDDNIDNMWQTI